MIYYFWKMHHIISGIIMLEGPWHQNIWKTLFYG